MKTNEQVYNELKNEFEIRGIECSWSMESGGIKVKKDGSVKLTFSLRNESTYKKDVEVMKEIVKSKLTSYKISGSNQFNSFRPEYRLIVTINP